MTIPERDEWSFLQDEPKVYHGTSSKRLDAIFEIGLRPGSNFGSEEVAIFFAHQSAREDGGKPVLICIDSKTLAEHSIKPDEQMIDFPIFKDYDIRGCEWEDLEDATGLDCLRIYESITYQAVVLVTPQMTCDIERLSIHDETDEMDEADETDQPEKPTSRSSIQKGQR